MDRPIVILEPDWGVDFARPPQFEMRYVEILGEKLYVLGLSHSAIKVGDSFRLLRKFNGRSNPEDAMGEKLLSNLRLRVESITAYHNQLNRIQSDMTAGMELSGNWEGLIEILQTEGWTCLDEACHQWRESLQDTDKLILER